MKTNKAKKTVVIDKAHVIRETEKAYLVKVGLIYKKVGEIAEIWIAKSRCTTAANGDIIAELWMFQRSQAAENFLAAYGARHKAHLIRVTCAIY